MKYLILTCLFITSMACKTNKAIDEQMISDDRSTQAVDTEYNLDNAWIKLKKGGCYGRCPSYDFSISGAGLMTFTSIRFCSKEGTFEKQLDANSTALLFKDFAESDFFSMQDEYESMIPDLPLATISFHNGNQEKTIKGKMERPDILKKLQADLESLAETDEGWTLIEESQTVEPAQYNFNELVIELNQGILAPKWVKDYAEYRLTMLKQLAPNTNIYLFNYDQKTANPQVIKALISKDTNVKSVSFNEIVRQR